MRRIQDTVTYWHPERGEVMAQVTRVVHDDVCDLSLYEQPDDEPDHNRLIGGATDVPHAAAVSDRAPGMWWETDEDNEHNLKALELHVEQLKAKIDKRRKK